VETVEEKCLSDDRGGGSEGGTEGSGAMSEMDEANDRRQKTAGRMWWGSKAIFCIIHSYRCGIAPRRDRSVFWTRALSLSPFLSISFSPCLRFSQACGEKVEEAEARARWMSYFFFFRMFDVWEKKGTVEKKYSQEGAGELLSLSLSLSLSLKLYLSLNGKMNK